MTANLRRALQLLPGCATTGIGSLPHTQQELGLQLALQVDVPYLPQLPVGNPAEFMIPQALEGLPGMRTDADGLCTVDVAAWETEREAFGARIEQALQTDALSAFEPSPQACRAFRPFLWEIENRRLALAKVQLAGPATVRWSAKTLEGAPVSSVTALDQQIFRLLLARCLAMVKAVRRANATPLLFLDEPGLYALDRKDPRHLVVLQELKMMVMALRREGALVGLHCCGNTDWPALLELGLDLLSLDVRLSLDAVLDDRDAFLRFLGTGASLALGIIPTNSGSSYDVRELVDAVEVSLRSVLPPSQFAQTLGHVVLTPACGLAMRTVPDAEKAFEDLRHAQRWMRELLGESGATASPA